MKQVQNYLLALALPLLAFNGCKEKESPRAEQKEPSAPLATKPATPVSAEKTSFQQVTSQLDPGGALYLYLGTEQWLAGLSEKVAGFHQLLGAIPDLKSGDRDHLDKVFVVVTNLIKTSGVEDVSGVGVSSIATEPGVYRSKTFVHHYPGKGSGFFWTLFGQKAHALDGLSLLPTNTAMAVFSDFELPILWQTLKKHVAQAGVPQAEEMLDKLPEGFEKTTGLKWDQVLASLGGEFGMAVTLDDEKTVSLPLPGAGPFEIPSPALMLVAKVKDDTIFNRIDTALKSTGMPVVSVHKPNLEMRTVTVPLPLPVQLAPSVAIADGFLFIATSDTLIQQALAVKSGQLPGLKSTAEFQRLAKDTPQQGNAFSFVSARFGKAFSMIQNLAISQAANNTGAPAQFLQSLSISNRPSFAYAVAANTGEGWLGVVNGNQHPAKLFMVSAVIPVAMVSAIALPNFVKARANAQKNACLVNLRQIDGAKQEWALEKTKADADIPSQDDLLPFIKTTKFLVCPAGGHYTINAVSTPPECSQPGHALSEL